LSGAIERIKPVCGAGANKLIKPWVYRQPAGLYCPAGRAPSLGKAFAPHHQATKIVRRAHFTHGVSTNDDAALWCIVNFVDFRQLKTQRGRDQRSPRSLSVTRSRRAEYIFYTHIFLPFTFFAERYVSKSALSWVAKATLGPTLHVLFFIYFDVNEWVVCRLRD
jgi:hypothetical protein